MNKIELHTLNHKYVFERVGEAILIFIDDGGSHVLRLDEADVIGRGLLSLSSASNNEE